MVRGQRGSVMAIQQTYHQAVIAVVAAASVDRSRAEPEWVRFEPSSLTRLSELFNEPGGDGKTKLAWREAMDDALADPIDPSKALALYRLKDRLTGSVDRIYDETPDGLRRRFEQPLSADQAQGDDLSWFWPTGA